MLNFEEGQPIAVIKKGKNQGQILRISENEEKETNRKENRKAMKTKSGPTKKEAPRYVKPNKCGYQGTSVKRDG